MRSMYFTKPKLEKTAGVSISNDSRLWSGEILKNIVSQHPYIDPQSVNIKFNRIDVDTTGSAHGLVIISKAVAIPFSIRKNIKTGQYELDNLDVLFDGEKYCALTESSLRKAIDNAPGYNPLKDKGKLPPYNSYMGDLTGDVTPLEYSGYPSGFTGSRMSTAGLGLLGAVIKNQNDVSRMYNLLSTYTGVNSALEAVGLRGTLEEIAQERQIPESGRANLAHVFSKDGELFVVFENGDKRKISATDLKDALGPNFSVVMSHVRRCGWCMVRDFPVIKGADIHIKEKTGVVIEQPGVYDVILKDGTKQQMIVSVQQANFDGTTSAIQKGVSFSGGFYTVGKALMADEQVCGLTSGINSYVNGLNEAKNNKEVSREPVTFPTDSLPVGVIDQGSIGCFLDESFAHRFTPHIRVKQIIEVPGDQPIIIAERLDIGTVCALIFVPMLVRPQVVPPDHYHEMEDVLPQDKFYIPAHYIFIDAPISVNAEDKYEVVQHTNHMKIASTPTVTISKHANWYEINGHTRFGDEVKEKMLSDVDVRTKLAWLSCDDRVIEKVASMSNGNSIKLYNLQPAKIELQKTAKERVKISHNILQMIKQAADDVMSSVDGAAKDENTADMLSAPTMAPILAMQFINEDSLEDIIDNSEVFDECEDKIARMLLSSRQGTTKLDEKNLERALKGIGKVQENIRVMSIGM